MLLLEFLYVRFILRHVPADVFPMIVVIGKHRIDFRQAQLRVCRDDQKRVSPDERTPKRQLSLF